MVVKAANLLNRCSLVNLRPSFTCNLPHRSGFFANMRELAFVGSWPGSIGRGEGFFVGGNTSSWCKAQTQRR